MCKQLQFNSSASAVWPQFKQGLCTCGARQQNSIIGGQYAIHTNPYATLEQVVSTFMITLAHKQQILTKDV